VIIYKEPPASVCIFLTEIFLYINLY